MDCATGVSGWRRERVAAATRVRWFSLRRGIATGANRGPRCLRVRYMTQPAPPARRARRTTRSSESPSSTRSMRPRQSSVKTATEASERSLPQSTTSESPRARPLVTATAQDRADGYAARQVAHGGLTGRSAGERIRELPGAECSCLRPCGFGMCGAAREIDPGAPSWPDGCFQRRVSEETCRCGSDMSSGGRGKSPKLALTCGSR